MTDSRMTDWEQITAAVTTTMGGDAEGGRAALTRCWEATGPDDHAARCVLAHYLADVVPDLADEITWDERALAEFASVGRSDLSAVGIADTRLLAPSLHLNLGDGYLRAGRPDDARRALAEGYAAVGLLPDDGYGEMIRRGLDGLAARIDPVAAAADDPSD